MSDATRDPVALPHPDRKVKVGHLVTGLVFLGLAATWALRANGTLGDLEIAVVVPVVLVVAGLIGLVALVVGNRRRAREQRAAYLVPADAAYRGAGADPEPEPTLPLQHPTPYDDTNNKEQ